MDTLHDCSTIDMSYNDLVGGVPEALFRMQRLLLLDLGNNPRLGGRLPCPLPGPDLAVGGGEAPVCMLRFLTLSNCGLEGPIPPQLLELLSFTLAQLDLTGNALEGEIPNEVGEMTNLQTLRLGNNQLEGSCPPGLLALMDEGNEDSELALCVLEGNEGLVASSFPGGAVNWPAASKNPYGW